MAIHSNDVFQNHDPTNSLCCSNISNLNSCHSIKTDGFVKDTLSANKSKRPHNFKDVKSPYLTTDKVQLLSRVTEKKLFHKKPYDLIRSFPLATTVYKSNSDEFKLSKLRNKKFKKSVLTLPNEPAPIPQIYTVSDLNDSECFNDVKDGKANKPRKRRSIKRSKKFRVKDRVMEYYDRDAKYCSQLNIDLDCSSSDIVNYNGDGERISKRLHKSSKPVKVDKDPHDVWAVLRNMNRFQFRPTSASKESVVPLRKRMAVMGKANNRKDSRIIETCRTEEFSYISSFEIDSKSRSCSPSSSFDRITVIDKQSEQDVIMQQFRQKVLGSNFNFRGNATCKKIDERKKPRLKNNKVSQFLVNSIKNPQIGVKNLQKNIPQLLYNNVGSENSEISINSENCHRSDRSNDKGNNLLPNNQTSNCKIVGRSGDSNKCPKGIALLKNPSANTNMTTLCDKPEKQLSGITKVILSKGETMLSSNTSESPRKPRLPLTLPNNKSTNFTKLEIKKRLANLKFPIVILGKDQLTNHAIHVANYDPPQFNGLDQHIWPFMLSWSEENSSQKIQDSVKKEILKIKSKNPTVKQKVNHAQDNLLNYANNVISKSDEHKMNIYNNFSKTQQCVDNVSSHLVRKHQPISIIKNKIIQLLQKSPTKVSDNCNKYNNVRFQTVHKDKIVNTSETTDNEINHKGYVYPSCIPPNVAKKMPVDGKLEKKSYFSLKYPWAKAKRANDFIENIIKKIRNGVYYSLDCREIDYRLNGIEVSTQTETNVSRNAYCQNSVDTEIDFKLALKKKDDPLNNISGFDKNVSTLRIESISAREIIVKHCVTNVVVQFDVQVLNEANNTIHSNSSTSFSPLYLKNKEEKIFKYNKSIRNSILPAELCSILPAMMRSILNIDNALCFPAAPVENVESNVTGISDLKEPKKPELIALPRLIVSDPIRSMLKGRFNVVCSNRETIKTVDLHLLTDRIGYKTNWCPSVNTQVFLQFNQSLDIEVIQNNSSIYSDLVKNQRRNRVSNCMALQPYEQRNLRIIPSFGIFNSTYFIKQIIDKFKVNEFLLAKYLNISSYGRIGDPAKVITISPIILPVLQNNNHAIQFAPNNKVGIISIFNAFTKNHRIACKIANTDLNFTTLPDFDKRKETRLISEKKDTLHKKMRPLKIYRKNSYVKFYRKCKSMSSISSYKSTPLSRITNLDEFCQILGSNSLSRVLDGCPEIKILAAVKEMKNWITEITPKQALLVLLLTNKKDTPNLIRFRPVLLQGIAVNRITRAVELDMEIEVIERENINKLSQFEGISYVPASSENQDNLFEELYWIAKTTASDYQKKFDESSEKLLKSLLQKRKKLNPSYLRLMARYVGLGLLTRLK